MPVPRIALVQYRRWMLAPMLVYVACMLLAWPQARSATALPMKITLALAPVVPVAAVIWLMAKRVVHNDELEQRVHMIGLGVATGVVAVLSHVAVRAGVARRYGGTGCG